MSFLRLAGEFTEAVYQAGREIPEAVSQAVRWKNGEDMKKEQGLYYKFNILIVGSIFICGLIIGALMLRTAYPPSIKLCL